MRKKLIFLFIIGFTILLTSGCSTDNMDGIDIVATAYPMEYFATELYQDHANIKKLYPDDSNIDTYKVTKKLLKDTSENNLFIYNGLSDEKDFAKTLLKNNNKIKIIDGTYGMVKTNKDTALWLDPSNILMIAQNIKNGLIEYITSAKLEEEVKTNYDELKIKLSSLDAELKLISENSKNKNLVIANDSLNFLNKYGFATYSIEENDNLNERRKSDVRYLIENGDIDYIIALENTKDTEFLTQLKQDYNIEVLYLDNLKNIKEEDRKNEITFIEKFNNNLELIKKETYE